MQEMKFVQESQQRIESIEHRFMSTSAWHRSGRRALEACLRRVEEKPEQDYDFAMRCLCLLELLRLRPRPWCRACQLILENQPHIVVSYRNNPANAAMPRVFFVGQQR